MYLPPKALGAIPISTNAQYRFVSLGTVGNYGSFDGGYCLQGTDKQCMLYVNGSGQMYIPQAFVSSFTADYYYDMTKNQVVYHLADFAGKPICSLSFAVQL